MIFQKALRNNYVSAADISNPDFTPEVVDKRASKSMDIRKHRSGDDTSKGGETTKLVASTYQNIPDNKPDNHSPHSPEQDKQTPIILERFKPKLPAETEAKEKEAEEKAKPRHSVTEKNQRVARSIEPERKWEPDSLSPSTSPQHETDPPKRSTKE